jgi:hypothetical protein
MMFQDPLDAMLFYQLLHRVNLRSIRQSITSPWFISAFLYLGTRATQLTQLLAKRKGQDELGPNTG